MLFCSEAFVFIFMPVFFLIYYIMPAKTRNLILFLGSLWFYFTGEQKWFFLIVLSLVLHFLLTEAMRGRNRRTQKALLVFLLIYDVGSLFFFKYAGLIFPDWQMTQPLGISFYTFQIAAYAIDVYRRPGEGTRSFVGFGTYVTMFPQLIAGPIVLFKDVKRQLEYRKPGLNQLEEGLQIFVIGLAYKMLIANVLGNLWHEIQVVGIESISGSMAWLGALSFTFQIYFDFNGYSLMALGLGCMLGFQLPRNFRQPYLAVTVTDFWKRWHMTLTGWFREYLYIPLGGNRKGKARTVFHLFIVWLFTGMWHGAGWNFLLWGMYYFVLLALEKLLLGKFWEKHRMLSRIYTLLAVLTGWVIFGLGSIRDIGIFLGKMFVPAEGWLGNFTITVDALVRYGGFFLLAILCSTYLVEHIYRRHRSSLWFKLLLLVIFWICVYRMTTAQSNPFLYFRF